ncbi:MAG: 5'-nucleotidase C-terminal domain-containing protein [Chloroflexota bacterium]
MRQRGLSNLSRRQFLQRSAFSISALGLAACGRSNPEPTATPTAYPTAIPTSTPVPESTPLPPEPAREDDTAILDPSVRLLWTGDIHGQLRPLYLREVYDGSFLEQNDIAPDSPEAYCCSHLNFLELAERYGPVGGYAYLATLIDEERSDYPDRTLLLDVGDTWYGSSMAYLTDGQANVEVMNALDYDAMTFHWEFNLGQDQLLARIDEANFPILIQNLVDTDFEDRVMQPSLVKELNGVRVAVVGEAYPFSMLTTEKRDANSGWRMGYRDVELQEEIDRVRTEEDAEIVVLLSHMGYLQDRAMAERLIGVDVIVGGHTHDILWQPEQIGQTLVLQAGSHGKFLGELDLVIEDGQIVDFHQRLIPVLANQIEPNPDIAQMIDRLYEPYEAELQQVIGETESLLYRRSLTGGSTDAFMAQAYREIVDADLGCTPGWRFGVTLLPGEIRVEDVYNAMKPTPTPIYKSHFKGRTILETLEDNLDNVFNADPLQRLGGDMNRCAGAKGELKPDAARGNRARNLVLNGDLIDADTVYRIANSGGRANYLDPESEPTTTPAFEELIRYIQATDAPIQAEPVDVFTFV